MKDLQDESPQKPFSGKFAHKIDELSCWYKTEFEQNNLQELKTEVTPRTSSFFHIHKHALEVLHKQYMILNWK